MKQGESVMASCGLDPDSCAVINNPAYFGHITLKPNETVYAHAYASSDLFSAFGETVRESGGTATNLKIVNP